MKTLAILLALSGSVAAATDDEIRIAMEMATATERGVELPTPPPEPAPSANIFADYPADKLRAALQPPAQPVARAVRPNVGSCPCGQGRCICSPASICPNGCPAVVNLRKDEVKYYFPAFDPNCPTGRP